MSGEAMKGSENLRPRDLDPETAAEMGRKGGKASGATRRKKADLKKAMNMILSMDLPVGKARDELEDAGIDPNLGAGLALSVVMQAIKRGDANALKTIASMAGQDTSLLDRQEQRARIERTKATTERIKAEMEGPADDYDSDGFLEALEGKVDEVWEEEYQEPDES